ncbi:MAG: hypothetical protein VB071_13000 [Lawsonibacter sp.]|nr:hypothetical protein [Lawsonibacter sp.]
MKKKFPRILLSSALVMSIGAAAVAGNGLLVAHAMSASNDQSAPVVSADTVQGYTDTSIGAKTHAQSSPLNTDGYQIVNKPSGQVIVKNLPDGDFLVISDNTKPTFVAGTPGANDISKEKALEIARKAIIEKYALSDETISRFTVSADFDIVNPEQPTWKVNYLPTDQSDYSEIGNYFVTIVSQSGEVVKLLSAVDGVG